MFNFRNVSLRWREKFEKHNKLFSFSHRLWWMQEKAIFWLVRILALRQAQPITEERTFCGCPGQRHLCTSEGRSSENWRNIKKDQRDVLPLKLLRRKLPGDRFFESTSKIDNGATSRLGLWQWLLIVERKWASAVGLVLLSAVHHLLHAQWQTSPGIGGQKWSLWVFGWRCR